MRNTEHLERVGKNNYIGFVEKCTGKSHIEDLGVDGKVILK
jgi:hypothetical protein